jgi:hypothetical protein
MENPTLAMKEADPKDHPSTKKSVSLKVLFRQIEAGIQSLKSKEDGQRIIAHINENNVLDEHAYATKLFESYAAIVSTQTKELNQTKVSGSSGQTVISFDDSSSGEMTDLDDIEFMREVPDYLYQGTGKQIAGWDALKRNIFWVRLAIMFFCLISYSVMESLPHVNHSDVVSSNLLLSDECRRNSYYGEFSYGSYKLAGIMGIVTWLYSLFFCLYYFIPADAQERKYIPASPLSVLPLRWEKRVLFGRKASSRYLEVFLDGLLLVLCLSAAISAAVSIDHSESFTPRIENLWSQECAYGVCEVGGCMNDEYACEDCDGNLCPDGSCPNPEGWCENTCDDVTRCLDGSCPNENFICDYGPDGLITTRASTGPEIVYYSLHTFVNTFDAMSVDCIDHNPLAIIRASISFLFFAVILLLVALQISLRSLYLEKVVSDVVSGKKSLPLADDSTHDDKA